MAQLLYKFIIDTPNYELPICHHFKLVDIVRFSFSEEYCKNIVEVQTYWILSLKTLRARSFHQYENNCVRTVVCGLGSIRCILPSMTKY